MSTKSVIISSSGLKNLVLNKSQEDDDFTFAFGEEKFQMKNIFAEFISPVVSHLHQTDPTINTIDFSKIIGMKQDDFNKFSKSLITSETISYLQQISRGSSIEINSDEAIKLRLLSILLGNDELQQKLNELFPTNYSEENVNTYMKNIECIYKFSEVNETIDFSTALSFIASHFYMIDIDEFLKATREIQYKIISHEDLQIESEDSLFDIISQIIEMKKDDDEISDILFLEKIEFVCLSETKFLDFVSSFDFNNMSGQLWQNLCQCFFPHPLKTSQRKQKKKECNLESIIVAGYDKFNVLGEKPNNQSEGQFGNPIIFPPLKLSLDPSSLLSYSTYLEHSVMVTRDGSLKGIGDNSEGQISSTLQKTVIDHFTDFCIKDSNGHQLTAISAVCSGFGTLYMFSKNSDNERQLVLCDREINGGEPIFLEIYNHHPVSLFGGGYHSAAIGSEGEIIFINRDSVKNSPNSPITAVSLQDGEKASSVACCKDSVVVLSSNGRVFASPIEEESCILSFSVVEELSDHEIVCVSGTLEHFLAVNKEGRVFVCGSNECGQLGLGDETFSVSSFTEISSLVGYEIKAAYAGGSHSFFETREGKILACGFNRFGELFLSSGPSGDLFVYSPKETTINKGAVFFITGGSSSVVFMGRNPPPNSPNMRIDEYK